jgi:hypothetical protein
VEQQRITLIIGVYDHLFCILSTIKYIDEMRFEQYCAVDVFPYGLILDFKVPALHFKDFFRPYLYSFLR